MAIIAPVTDRGELSRTTAEDMNRIVNNLQELGMNWTRSPYTADDIVRKEEWEAIVSFAQSKNPEITESTRWDNLNRIEALAVGYVGLHPSDSLYPSEELYPY